MAITLTIDNSYSKITGLDVKQHKSLSKLMSYNKPYNFFHPTHRRQVSLLGKRGDFPTGLMYIVADWSVTTKTFINIIENRVKPKKTIHFKLGLK